MERHSAQHNRPVRESSSNLSLETRDVQFFARRFSEKRQSRFLFATKTGRRGRTSPLASESRGCARISWGAAGRFAAHRRRSRETNPTIAARGSAKWRRNAPNEPKLRARVRIVKEPERAESPRRASRWIPRAAPRSWTCPIPEQPHGHAAAHATRSLTSLPPRLSLRQWTCHVRENSRSFRRHDEAPASDDDRPPITALAI